MSQMKTGVCPRCGESASLPIISVVADDRDGVVLCHAACGYCMHPAATLGHCTVCDAEVGEPEWAERRQRTADLGLANVDFVDGNRCWRERGRLFRRADGTYVLEDLRHEWTRVFPLRGRRAEVYLDAVEDADPLIVEGGPLAQQEDERCR